ncbi:MAG: hypothetical protein JNM07_04040 [Phycisphaerae bacterium]|nr:hypothetical protein [Phycisphaerae bacterium]
MGLTARDTRTSAAAAAGAILGACAELVSRLTQEQYAAPCARMYGASVGKHVRHVLDHFRAVIRAAPAPGRLGAGARQHGREEAPCEEIEYDNRTRAVPEETDRGVALRAITEVRAALDALRGAVGMDEREVRVRVLLSDNGEEGVFRSTLGRELAFASHHALHHHAMIGVIANELGQPPADGFGMAPSTLRHARELAVGGTGGRSSERDA